MAGTALMRRAVIHIGMPRTASTTLQHVLAHLRPGLEAAGILYPDLTPAAAAAEPHINHQHLGEALDGRRPRATRLELLGALETQLAATAADTVVLSYEDWIQERRAADVAAMLREAVGRRGFRMDVVLVVKPQDEHLNSIYAHRAQLMRERRTFPLFCRGFMGSRRFAYAELLDPWLAAAAGRVTGIPLRDRRSDRPLLHRILDGMGLADRVLPLLAATEAQRVENRSPGPIAVEVSRRLRQRRVPFRIDIRPRAAMRAIEQAVRDRGLDPAPFRGVDPALRRILADRYATTNDRFAQALWGASWCSVVAPEEGRAVNELAGRPIPPDIEAVIGALMQEACRRLNVSDRTPWYAPLADAVEDASELAQRRLRISSWRVI